MHSSQYLLPTKNTLRDEKDDFGLRCKATAKETLPNQVITTRDVQVLFIKMQYHINYGATNGPAEHWPTQFNVWPTQFLSPPSLMAYLLVCVKSTNFSRSNILLLLITRSFLFE